VAAEYEVNIKINTKKVETDLNIIDRKIKNLGKSTTSKEKSLERIVDKRARLMNRINEMEAKGLKVAKLRAQMGKATEQQSRRDLANAQREYRILERSIRLEQSKLRILRSQREGFPASPIRGIRSMMGSPAQIAASGRQRVSPIGGRIDIAGSPAQMQAIRKLEMAEMRADKNAHFAELKLIQRRQKVELDNIDKLLAADLRALAKFDRQLEASDKARQRRLAGANAGRGQFGPAAPPVQGPRQFMASPVGGAINIPGSPAFLRRQQRIKTLEQVGLGAGFPLLFGGGAGSVLGGAAGGLTGSFGAQIAFSAIGQQVDQFVASMVNAGKALTSVGGAADFMAEKSLFSSDAMQFRIEKLIEEGKVTEAAALMTQEMAKQVGGSGLKALKDLGTEASKMGKIFGTLLLRVQAFIAQALTPLIKIINRAIGGLTAQSQLDQMIAEAGSPERGAEILARSRELRGVRRSARTGKAMGLNALTPEVIQKLQEEYPALIPEGAAIEPTQLELLRAADKESDKGTKEEERLLKRLAKLEEERQKILEISRFKDQIAAAEALGDTQLVIRLQGEQKMAEIEASRKTALIGVTDQREIEAINIVKATEKLAAQRETERQITEEQRKRQELFDDTVADLEYQLAISQATSEAERERLRIEKKLQELRDDGMKESRVAQIGQLMEQISAENSPLNKFIKQSIESLNDLETQAVQISQGIGNAIGNSLTNGLQNLITGASSVKEVFADMLQSIADVLFKQAAQMISTYIAIGIARAFAMGMASSGSSTTPPQTLPDASVQTGSGLNINGVDQFIAPPAMASAGGYFGGPTRALVGEGGEPEYVIPQSKMRESMARYSRGARGSAVIPESGGSGTSGEGGGTAVAAPIDVRFNVERINNVDYVTAEEFQLGMQKAASQGAQRGQQLALTRLQQSPNTRRRLGL
tara:strand:+ start:39 stop:2834 length:2796 start_codon:yes stop_codon:yes gene_type:complete